MAADGPQTPRLKRAISFQIVNLETTGFRKRLGRQIFERLMAVCSDRPDRFKRVASLPALIGVARVERAR